MVLFDEGNRYTFPNMRGLSRSSPSWERLTGMKLSYIRIEWICQGEGTGILFSFKRRQCM